MRQRVWHLWRITVLGAVLPLAVSAQAQTAAPLSVIDWLDNPAPQAQLPRAPIRQQVAKPRARDEPAVAATGTAPVVITRPLNAQTPRNVGIVPMAVTGMQPDLWQGSDVETLLNQIRTLPDLELPAANALLFTVLLAEAAAPRGDPDAQDMLTRARMDKLMQLGAVDPALALAEQAGASRSPVLFDAWMSLGLLVGTEDTSCEVLAGAPHLTQQTDTQIFCAARNGDWDTAALTFGTAQALKLLPRSKLALLDRFLNPDIFEDAAPLPVPRQMDPLTFRLFETIGEALPTGPLPRAYAVADLRDVAGWKSQLEAAERLTRAGALPDNRLLGLYTNRKPAASGRIWDRVRAVQRFDTALDTGSAQAIAKTLPDAWQHIRNGALEVSFASAFQERLAPAKLTGRAARIQQTIGLLSPDYETVARNLSDEAPAILQHGVAMGEVTGPPPGDALPRAIYDAFAAPEPNAEWVEMATSRRLGEALLATLDGLRNGARGDSRALREALGTLRALGLEDTARRASLQILSLERSP
jgi:hypothetical protein